MRRALTNDKTIQPPSEYSKIAYRLALGGRLRKDRDLLETTQVTGKALETGRGAGHPADRRGPAAGSPAIRVRPRGNEAAPQWGEKGTKQGDINDFGERGNR